MILASAKAPEDLFQLHSLNYEVLSGNKQGISSIRLDKKNRLEFIITNESESEIIINICTLTEISNHYK